MANFLLCLGVLLAGASFVAFTAAGELSGDGWAGQLCAVVPLACHSPQLFAYAAVGLVGLSLLIKFISAVR